MVATGFDVIVRRQTELRSKRWGVYGVSIFDSGWREETLLEGGFFSKGPADRTARKYLSFAGAKAERRAGWNPNS